MSSIALGRRLGNILYRFAFPIYRPLYSTFKRFADRAEREILARSLHDGAVALDIGANIGVYSRFLSSCVGPSGRVYSFEPSPENFAHLSKAISGLSNVYAHQSAVSAHAGEQLLYVSDDLNVDHRLYPADNEKRRTVVTKVISLDEYFAPGARVDLIKLDVQGYEWHALCGATRVLTDNWDVKLLIEFWPYGLRAAGSSASKLLGFLQEQGFGAFRIGARTSLEAAHVKAMDMDRCAYFNLFAQRTLT